MLDWPKNPMNTFEVDDLDAYWGDIQAKDLPATFGGLVKVRLPRLPLGPRGARHRPGGVCWHVRQSAPRR